MHWKQVICYSILKIAFTWNMCFSSPLLRIRAKVSQGFALKMYASNSNPKNLPQENHLFCCTKSGD